MLLYPATIKKYLCPNTVVKNFLGKINFDKPAALVIDNGINFSLVFDDRFLLE